MSKHVYGTREGVTYHLAACEVWKVLTGGIETVPGQPDRYPTEFRTPDGEIRRLYLRSVADQDMVIAAGRVNVSEVLSG